MKCKYEGCLTSSKSDYESSDHDYCIFHADKDHKNNITVERFYELLRNYSVRSNDFRGFVFPFFIDFSKVLNSSQNRFASKVDFSDCKFLGTSPVNITTFDGDSNIKKDDDFCVSFKGFQFTGGANFQNCYFAGAVDFQYTNFLNESIIFHKVKFLGNAYFDSAVFRSCDFSINGENEPNEKTIFTKDAYFNKLEFVGAGKLVNFNNIEFERNAMFSESTFECKRFYFNNNRLHEHKAFFNKIRINSPTILFTNSHFATSFNNFKSIHLIGRTISFENSYFSNYTTFEDSIFEKTNDVSYYDTTFRNSNFIGTEVTFKGSTFKAGVADFKNALFNCKTSFEGCVFEYGVSFEKTKFTEIDHVRDKGKLIAKSNENRINVKETNLKFSKVQFKGDAAEFKETEFTCKEVTFDNIHANADLIFTNNAIGNNICFKITNIYFQTDIRFVFRAPMSKWISEHEFKAGIILFENVKFNGVKTSFEKLLSDKRNNIEKKHRRNFELPNLIFLFRYCYLKDVYFIDSDSSILSFYKSFFDEAIFISSRWNYLKDKILLLFPYKRKHVIIEDYLINVILAMGAKKTKPIEERLANDKYFKRYQIEDLSGLDEIAGLYRRFKTALDGTKDYIQAGWFYFNEFEMLRLYYKQVDGTLSKSKYFLYTLYKYFAGYGEKPLWSFFWLTIFTFTISIFNLLNGSNSGTVLLITILLMMLVHHTVMIYVCS